MNTQQPLTKSTAKTEEIIKDPTIEFDSPRAVLEDRELTVIEKRRILESWVKDAELLSAADNENMSGGENPRLRETKLALAELEEAAGAASK